MMAVSLTCVSFRRCHSGGLRLNRPVIAGVTTPRNITSYSKRGEAWANVDCMRQLLMKEPSTLFRVVTIVVEVKRMQIVVVTGQRLSMLRGDAWHIGLNCVVTYRTAEPSWIRKSAVSHMASSFQLPMKLESMWLRRRRR